MKSNLPVIFPLSANFALNFTMNRQHRDALIDTEICF